MCVGGGGGYIIMLQDILHEFTCFIIWNCEILAKVPKITILVTFQFSSLILSLLSEFPTFGNLFGRSKLIKSCQM